MSSCSASGTHFRERAAAISKRLCATASARRWHEPGPPPLSARDSRELTTVGAVEEAPVAIVAGFDVHRAQITFDALDRVTGEVERGRIRATPEAVRGWAGRFAGEEVHVAVEGVHGLAVRVRGACRGG